MFVICNENTRKPIRIWLNSIEDLEEECKNQAYNLSKLPFIYKWVCLMPDTHTGYGMPIGGVIATENVIIPNAVGVDIGCGMSFVSTNINIDDIKDIKTGSGTILQAIVGDILRNIPVGFNHHKTKKECLTLDKAFKEIEKYEYNTELISEMEQGYFQVGTLGGGNHFIEIQTDDDGFIGIMLHSGSRHFGKGVCEYFNKIAKQLNEIWFSSVSSNFNLAFLPVNSNEGKQYINWMKLCLDFAYENREKMMIEIKNIFEKYIKKYTDLKIEYSQEINCHHNYAAIEHHYNKNVWIHRKGAIRAREGDLGIIPGAMGSYSYIVEGKGCNESFCSSSHGAGRLYSRKKAMEQFSCEKVIIDLKSQDIVIGKHNKSDIAEESRFAYKNIDDVMENQKDLVTPIKRLKTIGVVKG